MYCSYCLIFCPCAVIHIHETVAEFCPWAPRTALYKAEEITLGLRFHQGLQLYSSDLFLNSFLLEALVWQMLQNIKNI